MNLYVCVFSEAGRPRSRSSVKDRHMISIKVLHLFLLLTPSSSSSSRLSSSPWANCGCGRRYQSCSLFPFKPLLIRVTFSQVDEWMNLVSLGLNAPQLNIMQFMRAYAEVNSHACKRKTFFVSFFPSLASGRPEPLAMLGYHCKTGQWNQMAAHRSRQRWFS